MVKLKQICLRTWYHSIRHAAWSIEYSKRKATRSMSLHQTCHLTLKPIRQDCCLIVNATCHSVYRVAKPWQHLSIYACWPSVFTAINTAAVQICLLVECCCKMDVCWTVATQSASLSILVTQSCMSAGVVLFYLPYQLSAMPVCVSLTTDHAC